MSQPCQPLTPEQIKQIICAFKSNFEEVYVNKRALKKGVLEITHSTGLPDVKINGYPTRSAASRGVFSTECSNGEYVNTYSLPVPDIAAQDGQLNTVKYYVRALTDQQYYASGVSTHWSATSIYPGKDHGVVYVYHDNIGNDPVTFAQHSITAVQQSVQYTKQLANQY
jgi:hypothetical protein